MNKKTHIIFTYGGGRLANQLLNLAHFYAFYLEHYKTIDVTLMPFWAYSNLFSFGENNPQTIFSENSEHRFIKLCHKFTPDFNKKHNRFLFNQFIRILHLAGCILPGKKSLLKGPVPNYLKYLNGIENNYQDLNEEFLKEISSYKNVFLSGYPFRNWVLFEKYTNQIRTLTTIKECYRTPASEFIAKIRKEYDLVIGVFIRQTDYKYWLSGKYYFTSAEYLKKMNEVNSFYKDKKVAFVIASDEFKTKDEFPELNTFFTTGSPFGDSHFIVNFAELSMCDYLITPPSTYGVWASFMGNVPIIPIYDVVTPFTKNEIIKNSISDSIKHKYFSEAVK